MSKLTQIIKCTDAILNIIKFHGVISVQDRSINIDEKELKKTMKDADIPIVSIALVSNGKITDEKLLVADGFNRTLTPETLFGAASLSKPVFSYLVLKLASLGKLSLDEKLNNILSFDEFCRRENFKYDKSVTENVYVKLTMRMVLSHTTGLNLPNDGSPIESQFEPGTKYSYSNLGIYYLQRVIEEKFKSDLQTLAVEHIFGPNALNMQHSCFYRNYTFGLMTELTRDAGKIYLNDIKDDLLMYQVVGLDGELKTGFIHKDKLPADFPDIYYLMNSKEEKDKWLPVILGHTSVANHTTSKAAIASNSLFTTAHDYAIFVNAWMNSNDKTMKDAFIPIVSMTTDDWANELNVPENDLKKVAWGLGWGLQLNDKGEVVRAYHTADMNDWRAQVAINLEDKTAIVYFANSKHGHILSDQIISPNVELEHALNYFFLKYGFTRKIESGWQEKEKVRIEHIIPVERNVGKPLSPQLVAQSDNPKLPVIKSVKSHVQAMNDASGKAKANSKNELSANAKMHGKLNVTNTTKKTDQFTSEKVIEKPVKNQKNETPVAPVADNNTGNLTPGKTKK